MHFSKYWLLVLAIVAGFICGRALRAEDGDCGCRHGRATVDATYDVIDDGYDENGQKTVYGPEEIRYQYITSRFCDAPAYEPTREIVVNNPNDYGRWGRGVYPHRYDTGMGLGGVPGSTTAGYEFVYGMGTVDPVTHDPVGMAATGGGMGVGTGGSRMDTGLGSSPGSGASGPGAGAGL